MTRSGVTGGRFKLLEEEEVRCVHNSALEILETVGVQVNSERYIDLLEAHGAEVDYKERKVRFSPETVERLVETAPSRVTLYGRKEENDMELEGRNVHYGTGGAAVKILDLESGAVRKPTIEDQFDLARLVDSLEQVDFYQAPVVPTDVPEEDLSLNSFYASLAGTSKNVQESVTGPEQVDKVVDMASIVAGGREKLLREPFISFVTSWMISPLKLDVETTEVLERITDYEIPVALSSAPVTGSTAPATLVGLLTLVHAEELFGVVLSQIFNPGAPVLYGPVPASANMRNMAFLAGSPETGMMNVASVQMAEHLDLPIYSDAGETDSKIPDAQAGLEAAFNILQVGLAGGNYIHHAAGMLESMLGVAYEKFVIDNDIIGMAKRVLRGIDVNEGKVALDVIKNVGPGNDFLTQKHTIQHSRSGEFYQPKVIDRTNRDSWVSEGRKDTTQRAKERVRDLLGDRPRSLLSQELDEEIRRKFNIHLPRQKTSP